MTKPREASTPVAPPVRPLDPVAMTFVLSLFIGFAIVAVWALDTAQTLSSLIVKHTGLARNQGLTEDAWIATLSACGADAKCGPWLSTQFSKGMGSIYWSLLLPIVTTPIAIKVFPKKKAVAVKDPGLAKWEDESNMKRFLQGNDKPDDPFMGFMGYLKSGTVGGEFDATKLPPLFIPREDWCQNTLVWGGIRSGKTTSFFQPNIFLAAHLGMSCVVFDVKWPQKDSGFFETIGYWHARGRRTVLLAPFEPYGARVNLLAGVNSFSDALRVADAVFPPPEFVEERGKHYNEKKRFFIASMVWLLRTEKGDDANFRDVLNYAMLPDDRLMEWLENIQNSEAKAIIMSYREAGESKFAEDKNGIISALKVFFNDNVVHATSGGEDAINLEDCIEKPTLTVVGVNLKNMMDGSGEVLFRLYKRMIDEAAMVVAERQGGKLRNHLAIWLDELPSIGRLNYMMRSMGALRSFNISHHLGIQNDAQSQLVYGELYWKAISTNVVARVIMFPRGINGDDARKVSETIGRTTASEIGFSGSHHVNPLSMEGSSGASSRLVERYLLAFEEFSDFSLGEAVVRMNGQQPIRVQLAPMGMKTVEGTGIKPGTKANLLYSLFEDTIKKCPGGLIAYTNKIIQEGKLTGSPNPRASTTPTIQPTAPAPQPEVEVAEKVIEAIPFRIVEDMAEQPKTEHTPPEAPPVQTAPATPVAPPATPQTPEPHSPSAPPTAPQVAKPQSTPAAPTAPKPQPAKHQPGKPQRAPVSPTPPAQTAPAVQPSPPKAQGQSSTNLPADQAWAWLRECLAQYVEVNVLDGGEAINVTINKENPKAINGDETIRPMVIGGLLKRTKTELEVRLTNHVMKGIPQDLRDALIDFPEARGVYLWMQRNAMQIEGTPERAEHLAKSKTPLPEIAHLKDETTLACPRAATREMVRDTAGLIFPVKRVGTKAFDLIPIGSLKETAQAIRDARAEGEKKPVQKPSRRERRRTPLAGITIEGVTPNEATMES